MTRKSVNDTWRACTRTHAHSATVWMYAYIYFLTVLMYVSVYVSAGVYVHMRFIVQLRTHTRTCVGLYL